MTTAAKRKALLDILTLEEKVQTLAMQTYRKWLPDARAAAVPEVASFTLPPDALNIVTTQASWEVALDSTFMEGMGKLLNAQILGSLQEAGISTLPATLQPTEVTTPKPLNTNTIQNVPTLEEFRRDYLTDVRNRMVNTPDTVFRQIAESIRQGTEQGESVDELRDRVEHLLSINNTGTWTNRAATVARTECLPADTVINHANITAVYRRPYNGAWVTVTTENGRKLSGTPNHPVLTGRGWVGLGELTECDHLISYTSNVENLSTSGDEHIQGVPSTIGEIFDSAATVAVPVRMAAGQPDFHGDGIPNSYVDVVRPHGTLRYGQFTAVEECVEQLGLVTPGACQRSRESSGLSFGQSLPVDEGRSFFTGAEWDARLTQSCFHGVFATTVGAGQLLERRSIQVVPSDVNRGKVAPVSRMFTPGNTCVEVLPTAPHRMAVPSDCADHKIATDTHVFRNADGPLAFEVTADHISSVEVGSFSGHVYNLTCSEGYFAANGGLVTSNSAGAYNAAIVEAAKIQQNIHDKPLHQAWLATIDARTRRTHAAADGQRVELGQKFSVGRAELRFPGDPRGPAAEVISCRCSVQILNAADDLPEESDRQTERGPGDATVRNRDGSRQDQIDKWRADGIIRARDDLFGVGVAASANQENTMTEFRSFTAKLMPLGVLARDGAQMTATDVKLVDTKLPLAGKWQEKDSPGHEDGFTVAVLETVEVDGDWVVGTGFMLNTPESAQAQEQSTLGVTQPSVEFVARESVMTDADGNVLDEMQAEEMWWNGETIIMTYTTIEMLGFTMVSVPNFRDTSVTFGEMVERDNGEVEQEAIAASAALVIPVEPVYPEELFSDPHLTELTPIHVTNDGRVIGHAAPWDQCHTGKPGKCKTAYHSFNGYADFHQSHVKLEDGSRLRVGRLTVGGGHAVVGHGMAPAVEHYDNVATCWAKVRAGEDEHGIWVSGVVNPDADPAMVKLALGTPHSGHWERVGGAPELIGIHAVNTPGYPLVKRTEDRFGVTALVASFMPRQARKLDTSILDEVASRAAKQAVTEYRNQEFGFRRKQSAQEVIAMASKRRREMVQQLVNSKGGQ